MQLPAGSVPFYHNSSGLFTCTNNYGRPKDFFFSISIETQVVTGDRAYIQ